jgi:hypothetical protein
MGNFRLTLNRVLRTGKRSLAIALAGLVLTATFLPATTSAQSPGAAHFQARPLDGVSDSPLVP